ncbi:MAG: amidohydrolase [Candidatus Eremiobacteraeota bacterium]|nr:amidohydrolase [Candidatus Eremiobacteraeota bacterium]
MSLLIRNAAVNGTTQDIYLKEGLISKIGTLQSFDADEVLDAQGKIALPSFFNTHTHAAMTLLRGYADDMFLQEWLEKKIWPAEARLSEEDVYWGARLACLEMIKSGTTFFNDMYWFWQGTARAVTEMGLRAALSIVMIDMGDTLKAREQFRLNEEFLAMSTTLDPKILCVLGPHAIYTVSEESLRWCADFSEKNSLMVHIHLSETEKEVIDCLNAHGKRPVEYLHSLGLLTPRTIIAHAVWVNDYEISLMSEHGVKVAHNPVSNMKLAVGSAMPYGKLKKAGVTVSLGTDGCSSNNNLDMMESMKFACLLQKFHSSDCCILPAKEAFTMATESGAKAFGLKAGVLDEGSLGDLILLDDHRADMTPGHNIFSDIAYSASSAAVDTVVCDGKILMRDGIVPGEDEIISKGKEYSRKFRLSSP